jgi:hypothetical protein
MKYTVSIEIALPRERVVQLLADPAHLPKWPRGLVLHEPLSGTHGQVGTTSRVVMQTGKQKIECTETITRREPVDLHGIPREHRPFRSRDRRQGHVERRARPADRSQSADDALGERERIPVQRLADAADRAFDARRLPQAVATAHARLQGVRRAGKDVRDAKG